MPLPSSAFMHRPSLLVGALAISATLIAATSGAWARDSHDDDPRHGRAPDRWLKEGRGHDHGRHLEPRVYRVQPPPVRYDYDRRWGHDHYYPRLGEVIWTLPGGSVSISVGTSHFHYHGGTWYRPYGSYWRVVTAPVGLVVPVLPALAVALRAGEIRYWYANGVYYRPHHLGGFVVVAQPVGELVRDDDLPRLVQAPVVVSTERSAAKPKPDPIVYPRQGQSAQEQEADLQACNRWATTQAAALSDADVFSRAVEACMDGRGYSLR